MSKTVTSLDPYPLPKDGTSSVKIRPLEFEWTVYLANGDVVRVRAQRALVGQSGVLGFVDASELVLDRAFASGEWKAVVRTD